MLRDATELDCALVFEWANDPDARRHAFSTSSIAWETHVAWYRTKLASPGSSRLFIAETEQSTPVGLIRFDREATTAVISFTVSPAWRGKGIGTQLLRLGSEQIRAEWPDLTRLCGLVKAANEPSCRAFDRAGFHGQRENGVWTYALDLG